MKLTVKNLHPLGFKTTGLIYRQSSTGLFYRVVGKQVQFISGHTPQQMGVFDLTIQQLRRFAQGRLSLVPPGFCAPMSTRGTVLSKCRLLRCGETMPKRKAELLHIFNDDVRKASAV